MLKMVFILLLTASNEFGEGFSEKTNSCIIVGTPVIDIDEAVITISMETNTQTIYSMSIENTGIPISLYIDLSYLDETSQRAQNGQIGDLAMNT